MSSRIVARERASAVVRPTARIGRCTSWAIITSSCAGRARRASPSPSRLRPSTRHDDRKAREDRDPRRFGDEVAALRDDAPEGRRRRRRTDADEGQRRLGQDSDGEDVGEPHDQRSEGIRQHMAAQDPAVRTRRARVRPRRIPARAPPARMRARSGPYAASWRWTSAMMTLITDAPSTAATAMASTMAGKAIRASIRRMIGLSRAGRTRRSPR